MDPEGSLDYTAWFARWEAQQARYSIDREARFNVLLDALEAIVGAGPTKVLDLGCGPGSLAIRLLDRLPQARAVGVDVDPVLLKLGRGAHAGRAGLRFMAADLRDPAWAARLDLDGPVDGAVSTTALHWLPSADLARLYADLAGILRPGGVFLDGDHDDPLGTDPSPLVEVRRALPELARRRRSADRAGETWEEWWRALEAEPRFAAEVEERRRLGFGHPHEAQPDERERRRLLRAAGFADAGVLWRYGHDRILAAVR